MAITNLFSILKGTSAQLTEWDPTTIAMDVEEVAVTDLQWDQLMKWHPFTEPGMTRTLTQVDAITMSVKTADTSDGYQPNPVAMNSNGRSTTVTAKVVDILLGIDALIAAATNARQVAVDTIGAAYITRRNTDCMSQYADGLTQYALGSYSYETLLLAPVSTLQGYAVKGRVHLVIPSTQTDQLYAIPQFSQAQQYGRSTLAEVGNIEAAFTGLSPLNVSIWHCPDYTAAAGLDWGMMFANRALEYNEKLPLSIGFDDTQIFTGRRALMVGATTFYSVTGTRESAGANKWIVGIGVPS